MGMLSVFARKFSKHLSWELSCFDRVICKGHLPISQPKQFEFFVDHKLKILRVDFLRDVAPTWSEKLVNHAKETAKLANRPYLYRADKVDKDDWAKKQLAASPVEEGLVGILCVMESSSGYKLVHGENRPEFQLRKVKQRVLYYYFKDRELGLVHVRIQTWAPFTCQFYANGHDYVARELHRRGMAFEQVDNAFTDLADPKAAQRAADRFSNLPWSKILERYARRVNPLLSNELRDLTHYWVIDQAEYATDLRFHDTVDLTGLFAVLVSYALMTFTPKKIFAYLGRRWHERFDGEIQTHYRTRRKPGTCIKHFMKRNWLKMYDKLGLVLRVETVINQPGEFKVLRDRRKQNGTTERGWFGMCKGIGNLHHYQSQALACNHRYLEALSVVDDPTPDRAELRELTEAKRHRGRSYAGFNPARVEDAKLFESILAGDHIAQGFRNEDIRMEIYDESRKSPKSRQHSAAVGRMFKRLQVRKLIEKVPRTRRWRVSPKGRNILGKLLQTYRYYHERKII